MFLGFGNPGALPQARDERCAFGAKHVPGYSTGEPPACRVKLEASLPIISASRCFADKRMESGLRGEETWPPLTPVRKTYAGLIRRKIFRVAGDEYTIFIQGTGPDNRIREFNSVLAS